METENEQDKAAIRALIQDWLESTKRGDMEHVLSLAHEDLIFHTPHGDPFGKAAFAAQGALPPGASMEGTADTPEIVVCGDLGYARTYLDLTLAMPGAKPTRLAGWSLTLYKRDLDGRWKLWRDANLVKPVSQQQAEAA